MRILIYFEVTFLLVTLDHFLARTLSNGGFVTKTENQDKEQLISFPRGTVPSESSKRIFTLNLFFAFHYFSYAPKSGNTSQVTSHKSQLKMPPQNIMPGIQYMLPFTPGQFFMGTKLIIGTP